MPFIRHLLLQNTTVGSSTPSALSISHNYSTLISSLTQSAKLPFKPLCYLHLLLSSQLFSLRYDQSITVNITSLPDNRAPFGYFIFSLGRSPRHKVNSFHVVNFTHFCLDKYNDHCLSDAQMDYMTTFDYIISYSSLSS